MLRDHQNKEEAGLKPSRPEAGLKRRQVIDMTE